MSPEQLDGHPALASGRYSLAIVAYEWLSGSRPFKGPLRNIREQQRANSLAQISGISPALQQPVPPHIIALVATALGLLLQKSERESPRVSTEG